MIVSCKLSQSLRSVRLKSKMAYLRFCVFPLLLILILFRISNSQMRSTFPIRLRNFIFDGRREGLFLIMFESFLSKRVVLYKSIIVLVGNIIKLIKNLIDQTCVDDTVSFKVFFRHQNIYALKSDINLQLFSIVG
jgi:hypothetical protein